MDGKITAIWLAKGVARNKLINQRRRLGLPMNKSGLLSQKALNDEQERVPISVGVNQHQEVMLRTEENKASVTSSLVLLQKGRPEVFCRSGDFGNLSSL